MRKLKKVLLILILSIPLFAQKGIPFIWFEKKESPTNYMFISDEEFTNVNKYSLWVYEKYFTNIPVKYVRKIYTEYKNGDINPLVGFVIAQRESEMFSKKPTRALDDYAFGLGIIADRRRKTNRYKSFDAQVEMSMWTLKTACYASYEYKMYVYVADYNINVLIDSHGDYALLRYTPYIHFKRDGVFYGNFTFPIIYRRFEDALNKIKKEGDQR